jgi:putative transcriptional regulator
MTEPTSGERIIESVQQAIDFLEGADNGCRIHIPNEIDVRRIREKVAMSQSEFAGYFGASTRTVQQWEQGRRVTSGASRAFLTVIDKEPEAVRRALVSATTVQVETPSNHTMAR